MKAAIDSNILLDLLAGDGPASQAAQQALAAAMATGSMVISPAVYAEVAAAFADAPTLQQFLRDLAIQIDPYTPDALWQAARCWRRYVDQRGRQVQCTACGRRFDVTCPVCSAPIVWRQHLITDFLIGGHAAAEADLLITRDRGYFRTYFPQLRLMIPSPEKPPPSL